MYYLEYLYHL